MSFSPGRRSVKLACLELENRRVPAINITLTGGSVPELRDIGTKAGYLNVSEDDGAYHFYTYSLVAGTGSDNNADFKLSGGQLLALTTFEYLPNETKSVRARVTDETGQAAEIALTIPVTDDPAIALADRVLTIAGSAGDDVFGFDGEKAKHSMVLNDVRYAVPAADVDSVVFHGGGGSDTASLAGAMFGPRTGVLAPHAGSLVAKEYAVWVDGVTTVNIGGSYDDTIYMVGSAGDDTLSGDWSHAILSGPGYSNAAADYGNHVAFGGGGNDTAYLTGTDTDPIFSLIHDVFVGTPSYAIMSTGSTATTVSGFRTVVGYANSPDDLAYLVGSAGNDTLVSTPASATLSGTGFTNSAVGYTSTTAYTGGGRDTAYLAGSAGNDTFVGTREYASSVGSHFANYAVGFAGVVATTGGGKDSATVSDFVGNDSLVAAGTGAQLTGPGFAVSVDGFSVVTVYATDGGINRRHVGTISYTLKTPGDWTDYP